MDTNEIVLADMDAWLAFARSNETALQDAYGTVDRAYWALVDGGLTLGGGAAPIFHIRFAD